MDAPSAALTLVKVSFIGNAATDWGGGLKVDGNVNVNLSNVTFSGNSAPMGGGIDTSDDSYGVTTLNHVTFSGNSGHAVSNAARHYFQIYHCVLWGDSGGSEIYSNFMAGIVISNSIVQGGYYGGGTNVITTTPRLGTLGYYGGATPVLPLLPGSSAIDGDSTTCPATDQRGVTRGTVCDLGAYEARTFNLTYTSGSGQSTPINLTFGQPLVLNISSLDGNPVDGGIITFVGPLSGASSNPITTTATITNGMISRSVTANGITGTYTVTASTSGAPGSVSFGLTNLKGNTTTSITSTSNPSTLGQAVTFTATVTSLSGIPDGTVQFYIDGSSFGLPYTLSGGKAITTTALLSPGTHPVTATYSGAENFNASSGVLSGGQVVTDVPITGLTAINSSPTRLMAATFFTATINTGSNVTYQWNFGDGQLLSGAITSHTYPVTGTYTAVVTATNSLGSVSATTLVTIEPIRLYLPLTLNYSFMLQGIARRF